MTERIDNLKPELFLDGPGEFIAKHICLELLKVKQWKAIFGDRMDPYMRMDYSQRDFPALRIYDKGWVKENESWFVTGNLYFDIILPASLRRVENQQIPATLCTAMVQQLRRPTFFENLAVLIPGLNELGKVMNVDKALAFEWGEDELPLTQISVNFRLDLRVWDRYLEDQSRTKDDPFERTLETLNFIGLTIQGLDQETVGATNPQVTIIDEDTNLGGG